MFPDAQDEPMLALSTGRLHTTSARVRLFLNAYRVVGGFLVRRQIRGRSWVRRQTLERVPANFAVVELADDACFRFPIRDHYWNRFFLDGFEYEPALNRLLRRLLIHDYAFLDCGANFGFWSVVMSSKAMRNRPVLAIEASRANFINLLENCSRNSERFTCWHRAVYANSGEFVSIFYNEGTHYGASLRKDWHEVQSEEKVATTTVDEAAKYLCAQSGREKLVVKLDVEGVEVEALSGSRNAIECGALVVYEDHPRDDAHAATQYLLDMGMEVRLLGNAGVIRIARVAQLEKEKQRADYEYNLAAFAPASWASALIDAE